MPQEAIFSITMRAENTGQPEKVCDTGDEAELSPGDDGFGPSCLYHSASALQSFSPKLPSPLNAYSALPEMLNSLGKRNSTYQNLLSSFGDSIPAGDGMNYVR